MAGLGKGVAPEKCVMHSALGFHSGMWYFLLYQKGGPKPPDDATHVFQCHYCEFEKRGRPNDRADRAVVQPGAPDAETGL